MQKKANLLPSLLEIHFKGCHNEYMEPNKPQNTNTETQVQPSAENVSAAESTPTTENPPSLQQDITIKQPSPKPQFTKKAYLIGGGVLLLLLTFFLGILFAATQNNKQPQQPDNKTTTQQVTENKKPDQKSTDDKNGKNYYFIYGTWTAQTSAIRAFSINNNKIYQIATLPLNVRKISLLNKETLLYIDQTDDKDNGRRISLYNIKDKSITTSIYAENNNTIYDYFLSGDKKYLVLWEIKKIINTEDIFDTGKSQIFSVDITNPSVKNLLYDEDFKPNTPIHYPRAILTNGTVFTDSYLPTPADFSAKNFGYGLSMVDFDGTNKKDIDAVDEGTYGIKPVLGSDGKYLLFAGYDGTMGDGKMVINGKRRAIATPNTLEFLNTQTLRRFLLPNMESHNYSRISWDAVTGNVSADIQPGNGQDVQTIIYDIESQSATTLSLPKEGNISYKYISQLPEGKLLIGLPDKRPSSIGNLGNDYEYAYATVALMDKEKELTKLPFKDHYMQYITVLPEDFFKSELAETQY